MLGKISALILGQCPNIFNTSTYIVNKQLKINNNIIDIDKDKINNNNVS